MAVTRNQQEDSTTVSRVSLVQSQTLNLLLMLCSLKHIQIPVRLSETLEHLIFQSFLSLGSVHPPADLLFSLGSVFVHVSENLLRSHSGRSPPLLLQPQTLFYRRPANTPTTVIYVKGRTSVRLRQRTRTEESKQEVLLKTTIRRSCVVNPGDISGVVREKCVNKKILSSPSPPLLQPQTPPLPLRPVALGLCRRREPGSCRCLRTGRENTK